MRMFRLSPDKKKKILLINFLPNDKVFADDNLNVAKMAFFYSVEKIVEKGENAGDLHFVLFPQYFQKFLFFQGH